MVLPLPACPTARFDNVQRVSHAPLTSTVTMAARLSRGGWRRSRALRRDYDHGDD